MRILRYKVQGQNIIRDNACDFSNIVRGTNNYIKLIFEWDEIWKEQCKSNLDYIAMMSNVDLEE